MLERADQLPLTLSAYLDDSGTHDRSELCVVAGYISTAEKWRSFSVAWSEALAQDPPITHSHAADMLGCRGPYMGLTKEQVRGKVAKLTPIIRAHVICGVAMAIHPVLYERVMSERVHKLYRHPYILCFNMVLDCLNRMSGAIVGEAKAIVVFDDQRGLGPRAAGAFKAIHASHPYIFDVQFQSDDERIPLQAADLHAWRLRKRSVDGKDRFYNEPEYEPLRHVPNYMPTLSSGKPGVRMDHMRRFVDALAEHFPA